MQLLASVWFAYRSRIMCCIQLFGHKIYSYVQLHDWHMLLIDALCSWITMESTLNTLSYPNPKQVPYVVEPLRLMASNYFRHLSLFLVVDLYCCHIIVVCIYCNCGTGTVSVQQRQGNMQRTAYIGEVDAKDSHYVHIIEHSRSHTTASYKMPHALKC